MKTFDLKPCREVGLIKTKIREAILDGIISNDKRKIAIILSEATIPNSLRT